MKTEAKRIGDMTDEAIDVEIARLERRRYNGAASWAMRLFDLRNEKRLRQSARFAEATNEN